MTRTDDKKKMQQTKQQKSTSETKSTPENQNKTQSGIVKKVGGPRKIPIRFKPKVIALRESTYIGSGAKLLIKKMSFCRLVREIAEDFSSDCKFQPFALVAIQEAAEAYIVEVMKDTQLVCEHRKRITIKEADMKLALRLRK